MIGTNNNTYSNCSTCRISRLFSRLLRWKGIWKMKRRMSNRRSPTEIKANLQDHYGSMERKGTTGKAIRDFERPVAYQAGALIRAQGQQIRRETEEEYLKRINVIRGDTNESGRMGRDRRKEKIPEGIHSGEAKGATDS